MLGDGIRAWLRVNGIRIMLLALVLSVVGGLLNLPVWTIGHGSFTQRPLSSYLADGALFFVLERVLYTATIVGLVGATLIEVGREDRTNGLRGWWNRERVAIATALIVMAMFLGSFLIFDFVHTLVVFEVWIALVTAAFFVVAVALGLYLLWTAERAAGGANRTLRLAAFTLGAVSAAVVEGVNPVAFTFFPAPIESWSSIGYPLILAGALFGVGSLALWVVVYAGILLWGRVVRASVSAAGEA
jgi:hypothetical protein